MSDHYGSAGDHRLGFSWVRLGIERNTRVERRATVLPILPDAKVINPLIVVIFKASRYIRFI